MKIVIATVFHALSVFTISFSIFNPTDFNHSTRMLVLGLGFFGFYITHAVMLKESWKTKNLNEIKILGLF